MTENEAQEQDRTYETLMQVVTDAPESVRPACEILLHNGLNHDEDYAAFASFFGAMSREMRGGDLKRCAQSLRSAMLDHMDS